MLFRSMPRILRKLREEEALTSANLPKMERDVEVNLTGVAELGWRWGLWVDLAPSSSVAAVFIRRHRFRPPQPISSTAAGRVPPPPPPATRLAAFLRRLIRAKCIYNFLLIHASFVMLSHVLLSYYIIFMHFVRLTY